MTLVAWVLALTGGLLAFGLAAGSAAGYLRRIDFYTALGVTPLPVLAMYLTVPRLVAAIRDNIPVQDLLVTAGPFLIGCFTLLGTLGSFRQQQSDRKRGDWR